MSLFGFVYLLSCVAFEFTDVLSLLTLEVYITFELIHCLRVCSFSKTNSGNQRGVFTLLMSESERKERGLKLELCFGGVPKMDLEGRFKNGVQKCEEDETKGFKSGVGSSEIYWCSSLICSLARSHPRDQEEVS